MNFTQILNILLFLTTNFLFLNCNDEKPEKIENNPEFEQYNISILLDLSDRIEPKLNPYQKDRDIKAILSILNILKSKVAEKGTFNSKDIFRIFFYPQPNNPNMASLASAMDFDLSKLEPKQIKIFFRNLDSSFSHNLNILYSSAINSKNYIGSDIWRFFKDEAKEKCIRRGYKNYLIVFTDGYIYWKYTMYNVKNRFSYILPTAAHLQIFRNHTNWNDHFERNDFGLIDINNDLGELNVLVLEINPTIKFPQDFDIINRYLQKWFLEMKIPSSNFKILKTDLPNYIQPSIENFLK